MRGTKPATPTAAAQILGLLTHALQQLCPLQQPQQPLLE
jgi:hypothetical protein